MLHIVNHMSLPVSWFKSYSMYSGATDAMVQWWYGHNAVGFFLTTGFLGMMYYFVPKQAGRPVYSYRLSIVHFWALITLYIWAGPHHLHYTALPDCGGDLADRVAVAVGEDHRGTSLGGTGDHATVARIDHRGCWRQRVDGGAGGTAVVAGGVLG